MSFGFCGIFKVGTRVGAYGLKAKARPTPPHLPFGYSWSYHWTNQAPTPTQAPSGQRRYYQLHQFHQRQHVDHHARRQVALLQ